MIRIARLEDLPQIVAIYNASIPGRKSTADTEKISVEDRLQWFHSHTGNRPLWVLEKDQKIWGWLSLQDFYGRCAYQTTAEISIYISPEYQRQGVAQHLMTFALREAPNLNISTLVAFIFAHNQLSINLFKKNNFNQWGYLPAVAQLDKIEKDLTIYGLRI